MGVKEFKAWFEGFCENMDGALFMCAVMGAIMIFCAWIYGV